MCCFQRCRSLARCFARVLLFFPHSPPVMRFCSLHCRQWLPPDKVNPLGTDDTEDELKMTEGPETSIPISTVPDPGPFTSQFTLTVIGLFLFLFLIDIDCPITLKRKIIAGSSHISFPTCVQCFHVRFLSLHLEKLGIFWEPSPLLRTHAQSFKYLKSKLPDRVCPRKLFGCFTFKF